MPREADFDSVEQRGHEDDAWFDDRGTVSGLARRDRQARVVIAAALLMLLLLGVALGAFSGGSAQAGADVERLRGRAKEAASPTPLTSGGNEVLLGALDKLVTAMPPPAPTQAQPLADVVGTQAEVVTEVADAVAAAEADSGPVAKVEPPKPKEPKEAKPPREPKEPAEPKDKVLADPFGIPRLEPKDAKVVEPKDAKVPETIDAKVQGPVDQALADAKKALDAGRWADARVGYEKVLQLSPGNTRALLGRGRATLELRQVQPALKDINTVLDAEPRNPTALLLAGSISQELGQKDRARGFYQRYLDAWPSGRKAAEVKALLERL